MSIPKEPLFIIIIMSIIYTTFHWLKLSCMQISIHIKIGRTLKHTDEENVGCACGLFGKL